MGIESDYIWFDGEFVPFAEATTHVLTHTLHYGLGAFEGIRAYKQDNGKAGIWRLDEHLERFNDSLRMMRLPLTHSVEDLRDVCIETLRKNDFTEAYLRPLAFIGTGEMGLGARNNPVHYVVASWKWGAYLGAEGLKNGVRLKTSSLTRNHPNASLSRAKIAGHYVNSIQARYEANDDGFDEALMLDANGYVAEGTGENVFAIKHGIIKTPPAVNILPGITRRSVIEILNHDGHEVQETFFGRDAFYVADEAFMCGTAAEVTPVREVDYRVVGDGIPGPLTRKVQQTYAEGVRGRVDWLRHHITLVE
ncbi:MAG: branched-chain amino acid transaminase [Proteobacteria bacterium]|nr:branched-chain amino acid transaminase [Pseudomonadota bacterium]